MIKKTMLMISSIVIAFSSLFSIPAFAASHEKAEEAEMECITQAALAEMSDEEKANLTAPMCEGDEGEGEDKADDEKAKED